MGVPNIGRGAPVQKTWLRRRPAWTRSDISQRAGNVRLTAAVLSPERQRFVVSIPVDETKLISQCRLSLGDFDVSSSRRNVISILLFRCISRIYRKSVQCFYVPLLLLQPPASAVDYQLPERGIHKQRTPLDFEAISLQTQVNIIHRRENAVQYSGIVAIQA